MATAREALTERFFRGDSEAARCLFESNREQVAVHIPGGAQANPLLAVDWMPHISMLLDNHDIGPFEFDVILNGACLACGLEIESLFGHMNDVVRFEAERRVLAMSQGTFEV